MRVIGWRVSAMGVQDSVVQALVVIIGVYQSADSGGDLTESQPEAIGNNPWGMR